MTKLVELREIFEIRYGNQLDLNKLEKVENEKGINFVSRGSKDCGVVCRVLPYNNRQPFKKGGITVTLGGSLLSAFLQQEDFYTAQNIKVLINDNLTIEQKLFYCYIITTNRFRYSSHAREANKTLDFIKVPHPDYLPKWVSNTKEVKKPTKEAYHNKNVKLSNREWRSFKCNEVFDISLGKPVNKDNLNKGGIPYITRTSENNGVESYTSNQNINKGNVITIGAEGIKAFYQKNNFVTGNRINIISFAKINQYNAIFLCSILNFTTMNKFNYAYAIGQDRLKKLKIKLPTTKEGYPDWQFMEDYIKSLPYSKNLFE